MDKRIGFLSFGHWQPIPGSQVRTGRDALVQSVELAVAAEELGLDGAYVRVHHFARQLASPFPLLTAMAMRTSRIELGTGVIDMRYENPLYMAEEAAAADLLSAGRLQLGISRGSPETALRDFAAPIQVAATVSCGDALGIVWGLARAWPLAFFLYVVLKIVLGVVQGVVLFAGACLTCCCILIPVVTQTFLQPLFYFERAWPLYLLRQMGYDLLTEEA